MGTWLAPAALAFGGLVWLLGNGLNNDSSFWRAGVAFFKFFGYD